MKARIRKGCEWNKLHLFGSQVQCSTWCAFYSWRVNYTLYKLFAQKPVLFFKNITQVSSRVFSFFF